MPPRTALHLWMTKRHGASVSLLTLASSGENALPDILPLTSSIALIEIANWRVEDELGADVSLKSFSDQRNAKIEALVRAMAGAAMQPRHRERQLRALSLALCRSLALASGLWRPRAGDAWLNPNAIRRVVDLIEDRLDEDLRTDELATVSGLSSSAFLRAFRGSLGMTPGDFLTACRIDRAQQLLKRTDIPIAVIAEACGFGTAAHFSTTFKARRGLQPRVLRRQVIGAVPVANEVRG